MRRLIAIVAALGLLGALAGPVAAQPERGGLLQGIPLEIVTGAGQQFDGTIDITSITRNGDNLVVTGAIQGLLDGVPIDDTFTATANLLRGGGNQGNGQGGGQGSCQILFLVLGPLHLDVLGLVIEIPDPITLDVRAEPGPGNLLGNLLCAVAGLLDGGPFAAIDRLLDRINQLL